GPRRHGSRDGGLFGETDRGPGNEESIAGRGRITRVHEHGEPHLLWTKLAVHGSAGSDLRRQDPQRGEARRPPPRTAYQVRACHQSEDRQGAGPHDSSITAAARRRDYSVIDRLAFITIVGQEGLPGTNERAVPHCGARGGKPLREHLAPD